MKTPEELAKEILSAHRMASPTCALIFTEKAIAAALRKYAEERMKPVIDWLVLYGSHGEMCWTPVNVINEEVVYKEECKCGLSDLKLANLKADEGEGQ